ncbi:MAG: hypothetical protein ACRERE_34555 [Candidatus Entotheonellia bacterium]
MPKSDISEEMRQQASLLPSPAGLMGGIHAQVIAVGSDQLEMFRKKLPSR